MQESFAQKFAEEQASFHTPQNAESSARPAPTTGAGHKSVGDNPLEKQKGEGRSRRDPAAEGDVVRKWKVDDLIIPT